MESTDARRGKPANHLQMMQEADKQRRKRENARFVKCVCVVAQEDGTYSLSRVTGHAEKEYVTEFVKKEGRLPIGYGVFLCGARTVHKVAGSSVFNEWRLKRMEESTDEESEEE